MSNPRRLYVLTNGLRRPFVKRLPSEMGIICLLGVGLASLFAVGAAQHVDQLWTVSVEGER